VQDPALRNVTYDALRRATKTMVDPINGNDGTGSVVLNAAGLGDPWRVADQANGQKSQRRLVSSTRSPSCISENPRRAKKSPRKARVPGGRRTRELFRERLDGSRRNHRRHEASGVYPDRPHSTRSASPLQHPCPRRALRGPQRHPRCGMSPVQDLDARGASRRPHRSSLNGLMNHS